MTSGPGISEPAAFAFAQARDLVRALDRDRYYTALFAPAECRPHLFALYAFNAEIARIRDVVREPLPGEVRLQWWRDLLLGEARGEVSANPLAVALLETIERNNLPRDALVAMIEARSFDLYDDIMPTWHDLEGYCGETASALIRLAGIILSRGGNPEGAATAGHAGLAVGFTGLLRNFPWAAARGQVVLPREALDRHGLDAAAIIRGEEQPGLAPALAEMRQKAREHLQATRAGIAGIGPTVAPAFLSCALVAPYLNRMEKPGYRPFVSRIDLPDWRKLIILWRQARRMPG